MRSDAIPSLPPGDYVRIELNLWDASSVSAENHLVVLENTHVVNMKIYFADTYENFHEMGKSLEKYCKSILIQE